MDKSAELDRRQEIGAFASRCRHCGAPYQDHYGVVRDFGPTLLVCPTSIYQPKTGERKQE